MENFPIAGHPRVVYNVDMLDYFFSAPLTTSSLSRLSQFIRLEFSISLFTDFYHGLRKNLSITQFLC